MPKDGDLIRDGKCLAESVRDEYRAVNAFPKTTHPREKFVGILRCQCGRRLIENQHAATTAESFDLRDPLLFRH